MKNLIALALIFVGVQSYANTNVVTLNVIKAVAPKAVSPLAVLNWKVNDSADYTMKGGMLNGTIHMFVREETSQGFWMQQDVDLGFMGKQKVEVHYDKNNGQPLEVLINGEKQQLPSQDDMEVVESRRESVTVPKGTFDSIYLKLRDKKKNQDSQLWVNPSQVPLAGMLKTISPTQMGDVTLELTNFLKH